MDTDGQTQLPWLEPSFLVMSLTVGSSKIRGRSNQHLKLIFSPAVIIKLLDPFFYKSH